MTITQLISEAIRAAILAGKTINEIYASADYSISIKADQTPVTRADHQAHQIILKELNATKLPVLSEEGVHFEYSERKNWPLFWLVDPLDGTKEFIKRTDDFTVNIALIEKNKSIGGVIYSPVSTELYVGIPGIGSYKIVNPEDDDSFELIQEKGIKLPVEQVKNEYRVAISRSHLNPETEVYIEKLKQQYSAIRFILRGSSLKTCMVAEGTADTYPRHGKTMEWDTAAGHAIAKAAGKNIYHTDLKTELTYNKESLYNPYFIVL
ncbi:MAG: 3'(2'),5'-bisphosphate nucleotidase CysQ [Prolixibacteraceae bacterium]